MIKDTTWPEPKKVQSCDLSHKKMSSIADLCKQLEAHCVEVVKASEKAKRRAEKRKRQEEEEAVNGSKRLRVGGSENTEGSGSRQRACWNCRSRGSECERTR